MNFDSSDGAKLRTVDKDRERFITADIMTQRILHFYNICFTSLLETSSNTEQIQKHKRVKGKTMRVLKSISISLFVLFHIFEIRRDLVDPSTARRPSDR